MSNGMWFRPAMLVQHLTWSRISVDGNYPNPFGGHQPSVMNALPDNCTRPGASIFYEFPILEKCGWQQGSDPGPDRVVIAENSDGSRTYCLTITYRGRGDNSFQPCWWKQRKNLSLILDRHHPEENQLWTPASKTSNMHVAKQGIRRRLCDPKVQKWRCIVRTVICERVVLCQSLYLHYESKSLIGFCTSSLSIIICVLERACLLVL